MDEKGKRTPGPLGRRSGIGLDQTMPEYKGSSEPQAQVRRPVRSVPEADALPVLPGAFPPEEASVPPRPAPVPPPAPPPPAPPPLASPPPQSPVPHSPPADLQHPEKHGVGPTPPEALEAAHEVEANTSAPDPPKRSPTSRLSTSDLDMTSNPRREDNLGIKFKSDRSRWW